MRTFTKHLLLITILIILLPSISAQNLEFPHSFYGTAKINARDLPVNSIIIAKINGVEQGRIKVTSAGLYGDKPINRFVVQKGGSTLIKFYAQTPEMENLIEAAQTANWVSAQVDELDLTFNGEEIIKETAPEVDPDTGGSAPSGFPSQTYQKSSVFINLNPDKPGVLEIDNENIVLTLIQFYVNTQVNNSGLTVKQLTGAPDVTALNDVFGYLEITANNLDESNLDKVYFKFHIPISWFTVNNYDRDSVVLLRYKDGVWQELNTSYVNKDAEYYNYAAESTGFSYFTIQAEKIGQEVAEDVMEEEVVNDEEEITPEETTKEDTTPTAMVVVETIKSNSDTLVIVLAIALIIVLSYLFYDKVVRGV